MSMEIDSEQLPTLPPLDEKSEHALRKAETVLRHRTDRVLLVLERILDNTNYLGALRTAEIMGVQNVWVVQLPRGHKKAEQQKLREQQLAAAAKQKQQGQQGQGRGRRRRGRGGEQGEEEGDARGNGGDAAVAQADAAGGETGGDAGGSGAVGDAGSSPSPHHRSRRQRVGAEGEAQQGGAEGAAVAQQQAQPEGTPAGGEAQAPPPAATEAPAEPAPTEAAPAAAEDAAAAGGGAEAAAAGGAGDAGAPAPCLRELLAHKEGDEALTEEKRKQEIRKRLRFSRASAQWLDVRFFWSVEECIAALREEEWTVWATDLSQASMSLSGPSLTLPPKLAVVMGREADGVSAEMLAAADRRVYLPMWGFNGSLNVMVATGMVLSTVMGRWPEVRGGLSAERVQALRRDWYGKLARNETQRIEFERRAVEAPLAPYADAPDLKDLHLLTLGGVEGGAEGEGEGVEEAGGEE